MPDPKQLPFLLKLMDDDSPVVANTVLRELRAFGPALREELARLPQGPDHIQKEILDRFLKDQNREWLKSVWRNWFVLENEAQRLEAAFNYLSQFQNGFDSSSILKNLLDHLADEYLTTHHKADPFQLSHFLFQIKHLKGAFSDYYNPQNSNLTQVIQKKKGIPISLVVIFILVADRLGIKVTGCNFPGHFLARINLSDRSIFVDCFNGGRLLDEKDLASLNPEAARDFKDIVKIRTTPEVTIGRVLNNLSRAYRQIEEWENHQLMVHLLEMMNENVPEIITIKPSRPKVMQVVPLKPGQRVRHKKLGYQGVVVHCDPTWQSQPDMQKFKDTKSLKKQPWYHVLVHDTDHFAYASHHNLVMDLRLETVNHPLTSYFFNRDENGLYIRNSQPWPGI